MILKYPCSDVLVELSRGKGCDPMVLDNRGSTPFHTAAQM